MEVMMNQDDLWSRVATIKRRVRDAIGANLSHEFRSTQEYQAYTGLCGEAQMAYTDGELDEQIVAALEEYAAKVIARRQKA
jgi:bacterioferritin (cytochrome b1)